MPDNSIVAGVPARVICSIEEFRHKHKQDFILSKGMAEQEKRELVEKIYNEKDCDIH